MCGRYVSPDQAAMERAWNIGRITNPNPFRQRFNVSPTTKVPVLRLDAESGDLELAPATWGLIPIWWKEATPPRFTFNARCEEGATEAHVAAAAALGALPAARRRSKGPGSIILNQ